jgi:hypothetical protein
MRFDPGLLDDGLTAANQRTKSYFKVAPEKLRDLDGPLRRALEEWPAAANPRFVTLFVELWAIAESARLVNEEPRLTENEIRAFLGHASTFLNSFIHK